MNPMQCVGKQEDCMKWSPGNSWPHHLTIMLSARCSHQVMSSQQLA